MNKDADSMTRVITLSRQELYKLIHECILEFFSNRNRLFENAALLKTYNIRVTKRKLKSLGLKDNQIQIDSSTNGINKIIVILFIPQLPKELSDAMASCGYFFAKSTPIDIKDQNTGMIIGIVYAYQFEPKHEDNDIRKLIDQWNYIYHISPSCYQNKIGQQGFCPTCKSKTFNYPSRNYFFKGDIDFNDIVQYARIFANSKISNANINPNLTNKNKDFIKKIQSEYTLYYIDTRKIPINIKFFLDPNLKEGFYTEDNIPASCIAKEKTFSINNN